MNKNKQRYEHISKDYKDIKEYKVNKQIGLLDFLFETFKDQSRTSVKQMLSNRRVSVDGAPITQFDFKLFPGDTVLISKTGIRKKTRKDLPIIFENQEMIVINKPSGLLSVASDKEKGSTAYRMLSEYVQQKDPHNRIFIVHRIDEDTSGVFMVVKNQKLQQALQDNWNDLVKKRGYYAIVDGEPKEKNKTIKSWLKKNSLNLMYSSPKPGDGQFSVTHYQTMKTRGDYTLLDVNIDSGRKNQIRVHLGEMGHNIIGDDKYGNPTNPIGRLGLHAYELDLIHPLTKKLMKFIAPMPKEFEDLMNGTYVKSKVDKKKLEKVKKASKKPNKNKSKPNKSKKR